jgi:AcrR family transcriptional regulator
LATGGKNVRGADTRERIAQATLRLVGEHGVSGTSTARIAAAVGVSEAALYRHFKNRDEMIRAALDALYGLIFEIIDSSSDPNALERLRQISRTHVAYSTGRYDTLVAPFLGFVTSPIGTGFRQELENRQQAATDALASIIEQGQSQGTIREEVDPEQAAWELVAAYWADVMALGIGLRHFADEARTSRMLDFILDGISAQPQGTSEAPAAASQGCAIKED